MSKWWNQEVGAAGQGMYDDPWLALNTTMVNPSLFPSQQQPALGNEPTAQSLGMTEDDFKKYVNVNKDGSWSVATNMNGTPREKGFMGFVKGLVSDAAYGIGQADKGLSKVPILGDAYRAQKWLANNLVVQPLDKIASGSYWLYSETVSQPLTAAILQMGKAAQGNAGALVSGREWADAYDKGDNPDLSPGRALANVGGTLGLDPLQTASAVLLAPATGGGSLGVAAAYAKPQDKYANERYLYDTNYWEKQNGWKYSVGTGLMDATASVALDPTVAAGKVIKPIRLATRAVKVAEGMQEGVKVAGMTVIKPRTAEELVQGDKFVNLAQKAVDEKWSPTKIQFALERGRGSRGSNFTSRDMAAQLSDVLSKANSVEDWQLATRFAMGDAQAFAEMSAKSTDFALAYGKALDHRVNLFSADSAYKKSFGSLIANNFEANPIKPARYPYAVEERQGALPADWEYSANLKRPASERVKIDEQGRLFPASPYARGTERLFEDAQDEVKPFQQLAFEGKAFKYEVKPLDPELIPTNYYQGVNIPGMVEWRAGMESNLTANKVQLEALAKKNDWLAAAIGNLGDPAAVSPLFGSMQEARFAGVGRNVVKQAERREVQYLGARANEGFQSRLLQNGIYGATVRLIGKAGDRMPSGILNHNDADAALRLSDYLKASPLSNDEIPDIIHDYSRIANKSDSIKYIEDVVEPMVFESLGKKHKLDLPLMQEMFNRYRQISSDELGKARYPKQVFSAAQVEDANGGLLRVDKMRDGENMVASPMFQTQLQYTSVLPNLKQFDRFLAQNAGTMGRMRRAGIGVYDVLDNVADTFNTTFKLGNLLRVAYVARNVAEETLAQSAKFGAFAVMSSAARGGGDILRNRTPLGALVALDGAKRQVEVNRALPMVQSMKDELTEHVDWLNRRKASAATFGEDPATIDDRLMNAKASLAEFQSYEDELLQHAVRQSRALGEGTFMYRGQAIPEAFNENYAGAIPRDQITSSESWKTVFTRVESFGKEDMMRSGNHVTLTPSDVGHLEAWDRAVNLQILQDPVGIRVARDATGEEALKFLRSPEGSLYRKNLGAAGGREPAEHIALVKAMIDQYIPDAIREQAAKNGKVALDDFRSIPEESRPMVHGEELKAAMKGNEGSFAWFDRLNDKWFQGLPRMASDRLSWQPTYVRSHRMHMQELIDLHFNTEAKLGNDVTSIPMDTMNKLMLKADKMARSTMKEVLYQPNRTRTGHALRYISPFFSAYTDSMARWGGLVLENPDLVGKMAKIYNAPVAANLVTDRYGQKVNADGTGKDGKLVEMNDRVINFQVNPLTKNLPAGISDMNINVGSLNVVTPGEPWWSPGFGPMVALPANELMRNFPETAAFVDWVSPYGTQAESFGEDVARSLLPTYAENLLIDYDKDGQKYQDALMASYRSQVVDYHQNGGGTPDWKKAEKDARNLFFLNALADFVLPGKTRESDKYQFYVDALKSLREEDSSTANDRFMAKYGEDFKEFADAQLFLTNSSKSKTGVPSTVEGLAQSEAYGSLIKAHPELGAYIVGDQARAGEFSSWALLNQRASGDRTTVSAEDRVKQTAINSGWEAYVKIAESIRADMTNRGLTTLQQRGAEDLAALKQRAVTAIANKYPQWAEDYTVTDRDAIPKRIQALKEIVSDPRLQRDPSRTDIKYMTAYLTKREQFARILQQREASGGSAVLTAKSNYDIALGWSNFREAIAEKDTKFSETMERFLSNDQLQTSIIGG